MGRTIRRVPPDWQHPRDVADNPIPLYEEDYDEAAREWLRRAVAWDNGSDPQAAEHKPEHPYFWDWDGMPPDRDNYRERKWTPEEATAFQVYENVTEGTPVSPVLLTEAATVAWLVENWKCSEKAARSFLKGAYVPSMALVDGRVLSEGALLDELQRREELRS